MGYFYTVVLKHRIANAVGKAPAPFNIRKLQCKTL
jgi:hypothetical protein